MSGGQRAVRQLEKRSQKLNVPDLRSVELVPNVPAVLYPKVPSNGHKISPTVTTVRIRANVCTILLVLFVGGSFIRF